MAEYEFEEQQVLAALRQAYYGLLVRLLWSEPDRAFIASLVDKLEEWAETAEQLQPLMGEGWRAIGAYLADHDSEEIAEEFTLLFLGPSIPQLSPYESRYLTGSLYNRPLIEVRQFMKDVGLEKEEGEIHEPEDMLAFELEIMNWLVSKEKEAPDGKTGGNWYEKQAHFFKRHLQVWGPQCARDLQNAPGSNFYKGVGLMLEGFLQSEAIGFHGIGPEKAETLEEAQKRLNKPTFKGEVYDPDPVGEPPSGIEN